MVAAFSDLMGMDKKTALRLASSFGGGMGRMREVCGAVTGMFMVVGILYGYDDAKDYEGKNDPTYFSESLLRHYYKHKDFYLLLYNQGLSNMILEALRVSVKLEEANNNLERYAKSMIAGMIWGWVDEWMRQGMPETPEEIVLLTAQLNKEQPKQ